LFSDTGCSDGMDPVFLSYSQANGVPQESKLATYMVNYLCLINSVLIYFFILVRDTYRFVEYYSFDKSAVTNIL